MQFYRQACQAMWKCKSAANAMLSNDQQQSDGLSEKRDMAGRYSNLDTAQNPIDCSGLFTCKSGTRHNGSPLLQESKDMWVGNETIGFQLINDPNVNQSAAVYVSGGALSSQSKNVGTTSVLRRHRLMSIKRNRREKMKQAGRSVKRKSDGKFARIRTFPSGEESEKVINTQTSARRNKNNSKKTKHKNIRKARHNSRKSEELSVNVSMLPPFYMPNFPAPGPPMNTAAGIYTIPQMSIGNPSIMQPMPASFGSPLCNAMFPPSTCPYLQPYSQQNGNDSHTQLSQRRRLKAYSYKPMCNEFPLALGCGRWYRLQLQEEAKGKGFLPLLQVMFCCCFEGNVM